jgi:hypothetical protein
MKPQCQRLAVVLLALLSFQVSATTHYVDVNSASPASPYTNWVTAATNIQSAVNIASTADLILVTNGIYQAGGCYWVDSVSNRVVINKAVTVGSVNGPMVTTIRGYQLGNTNTPNAVRCVYLQNGATLSGFTLTNGSANGVSGGYPYLGYGAGVYCQSTNCMVTNCIIAGNVAVAGGGAYYGMLVNCFLSGNGAGNWPYLGSGGGAYYSTLINCVLTGNSATYAGGGADWCTLINCTVVGNLAGRSGAMENGTSKNCILYYNSPDNIGFGGGIGYFINCCVTPLPFNGLNNITNAPQLVNRQAGDFHLQPWSPCINAGNNTFITNSTDLDGNPRIFAGTVDIGAYENNYTGTVHYVRERGTNAINPYSSWSTAAQNIQDAVGAAQSGEFVIVGDGLYIRGGAVVYGQAANRVALTNDITLLSLNGPQAATISGEFQARCAYVGSNAMLGGFTLTFGATRSNGDVIKEQSGGGVWCETGGVVSNCLVTLGHASYGGGGIYGGTIYNSILGGNSAYYGGGAYQATLNNCTLTKNSADNQGGGTCLSTLHNCIVYYNDAPDGINHDGVGMYYCCTTPLPISGSGNITNEPVFVNLAGGDFHLQTNSPCINSGNNTYVTGSTDLDGNPRIIGGTVDIGAYEFQSPVSQISYAWLYQYQLPINANTDLSDADNDGMNNWQEWHTGTVPNDPASLLKMLTPTNDISGTTVTWQSVSGVNYFIQRRGDLSAQPPFSTIQSNIVGQAGTTSWLDITAAGDGPFFYRVGVQ